MWLNGETAKQMAHAEAVKQAGGVSLDKSSGSDTIKDQKWDFDESWSAKSKDHFVFYTTCLYLGLKIPVFLIPMLLAHLLPALSVRFCGAALPYGTERVHRSCGFYAVFTLTLLLSLPIIVLVLLSLTLDYILYYVFSLTFCALTCRWSQACASMEKIRPFQHGPSILTCIPDFFVCIMGQIVRKGYFETVWRTAMMWLVIPWLKYYINCNPWVYDLDQRFVQQITTTMQDLGTEADIANTGGAMISEAVPPRAQGHRIDRWGFVPYYPYPPPDRRWALGLQSAASMGFFPAIFFFMVHTTHAKSAAGGSSEQFVLSNSVACPVYRVMLWHNNPFHFLTGWVEASVSNGKPWESDEFLGGEHPMWLVSGRTPMVAARSSFTGGGFADIFFDYWLPVFVHECRRETFERKYKAEGEAEWFKKALEYADSKYEEVVSKDGLSRPNGITGRSKYQGKDAVDYYEGVDAQAKDKAHDWFQSFASTRCGLALAAWLQGPDMHRA